MTRFTVRPFTFARRTAAFALVAGASTFAANAQSQAPSVDGPAAPLNLVAALHQPLDLASSAAVNYSSSTADTATTVDADAAGSLDLSGMPSELQPPPRRRYGRPRYNDSSHNPDGSNKYAFVVGAGASSPVQDFSNYNNLSYGFQVGAGRNFNKNFALMFQFDYDNFGFKGATLQNQLNLYNFLIQQYNLSAPANSQLPQLGSLDGNSHVWSFTLNPVYTIYSGEGLGAYVVGGVGFYHKAANFTTPATGIGFDGYEYYQYVANQPIDQYFSNAVGFNGGFGLTFKPSRFAGERLFAEVRYHYMLNSLRSGVTLANVTGATSANTNFNNDYPQNSHRTAFIPVKVGIRF